MRAKKYVTIVVLSLVPYGFSSLFGYTPQKAEEEKPQTGQSKTVAKEAKPARTSTSRPRRRQPARQPMKRRSRVPSREQMSQMLDELESLNRQMEILSQRTQQRYQSLERPDEVQPVNMYRVPGDEHRIADLEKQLAHRPGDIELLTNLAHLYERHHIWEKAEQYLSSAVSREPLNQELLINLGYIYLDMGRYPQAWNTFQEVLYLNPDHEAARLAQGEVREAEGQWLGAMALYERYGIDHGFSAALYASMVNNLERQGETSRAIQVASEALENFPDEPALYLSRGLAYAARGMWAEAKSDYYDALALDVDLLAVYPALGDVSMQEGHYPAAIRAYLRWLNAWPGDRDIIFRLGSAYLASLELDKAITEFAFLRRVDGPGIELDRSYAKALYLKSMQLRDKGDFTGALNSHRRALEIASSGGAGWAIEALTEAGAASRQSGYNEQSLAFLNQALEMNASHIQAWLELGRTYMAMNDTSDARWAVEQARRLQGERKPLEIGRALNND